MRLKPIFPGFFLTPLSSGATVADCGIGTTQIADSAVTAIKIADSSVDSTELADSAVSTQGLQDSAVTSIKIADCAVDSTELSDSSVSTLGLQDCAATYAKIQNVTAQRLLGREDALAGSVQEIALSAELRFDTTNDWVEVSDSGITSGLIADSAVLTAKISDSQVTYAKIQAVTASRLLGRHDTTAGVVEEVALNAELRFDTTADALEVADSGIITGLIADSAVTSAKIADSAIVSADIQDCGVNTVDLTDCAVTSVKIQDSTIVTADLADCAVTNAKLGDTAVVTAKINNTAVTYAKIQDVTAVRLLGREDALAGSPQEIALSAELRFDTTNDWVEVADCGINTALLTDCAVTSIKIQDSTIVAADLADCAVTSVKLGDSAATTAKINDGAITASKLYDTTILTRLIEIHATDTTLAVGDTLATFFVPTEFDSYDLVRAAAAVKIVSTTGTPTIQLRDVTGTGDMLSTKITIDSGEKTSYTAVTAPVVDTTNDTLLSGQEIAIDIDSAGTAAEDLYVILSVRKP